MSIIHNPSVSGWFEDRGIPIIRVETTGMSPDEVEIEIDQRLADQLNGKTEPESPKPMTIRDILERVSTKKAARSPRFVHMTDEDLQDLIADLRVECAARGVEPDGRKD